MSGNYPKTNFSKFELCFQEEIPGNFLRGVLDFERIGIGYRHIAFSENYAVCASWCHEVIDERILWCFFVHKLSTIFL